MSTDPLILTSQDLIFSDFDATITLIDTGLAMINSLPQREQSEAWDSEHRWRRGEISSMECLREQWGLWTGSAAAMFALIDGLQVDERFFDFLALVRVRRAGLAIVSDGLEFYLDRMLARYGLSTCADDKCVQSTDCVLRFSNPATVTDAGVSIEFPYGDKCGQCGNCKAHHLFRLRRGFERVIYIGDGHSDLCAARYADVIFAKDALAEDCLRSGRAFHAFHDFSDILSAVR